MRSCAEKLNPEMVDFLSDWLKEESKRMLPQLKIKSKWLQLDGIPISDSVGFG